jgi:hypothetical protein
MRDRRQSERLPSIVEGRITLGPQALKLLCTLRDISATGARIWLPDPIDLPNEFQLEIPVLQQTVPVRLMWSKGKTHGIHFLEELPGQLVDETVGSLEESEPLDPQPALQGIPRGLVAHTERILDDARQHLADILDMPAEKIRLRLEIDP